MRRLDPILKEKVCAIMGEFERYEPQERMFDNTDLKGWDMNYVVEQKLETVSMHDHKLVAQNVTDKIQLSLHFLEHDLRFLVRQLKECTT